MRVGTCLDMCQTQARTHARMQHTCGHVCAGGRRSPVDAELASDAGTGAGRMVALLPLYTDFLSFLACAC